MTYMRESIERAGWRAWVDRHPAPGVDWGADEFDILMQHDAPTALIQRIWRCNWKTANKYVENWKKQNNK